jgi:polyisoprenoid-binding protein YceI
MMTRLLPLLLLLATAAHGAELDPAKSKFTWVASKITGSSHTGQLTPISSSITVEAGSVKGGEIVLDLKNFTVTDLTGKIAQKFLGHVKSADFFNVEKFPTSRLEVTEVKEGTASGRLQTMGKIKPVTFTLAGNKAGVYTGQLKFDRTDFGIVYGSGKFFKGLGDKVISDEVIVNFEFELKRDTPVPQAK